VPPAPRPQPAPSAAEIVDEQAESFFRALRAGDDAAAARDFVAQLAHDLPPARLAEIRREMIRAHGPIVDWECTRKTTDRAGYVRVYELRFARGAMSVRMAFDWDARRMLALFFARSMIFRPAPTPDMEARISTHDLTVGPGLGATITAPRDGRAGTWPAAVLVPGSGPNDRDETVGPVRPFRDLAEGLAARGIVTIRFDKRTFARPELFHAARFTVDEEFIDDALSAISAVAQQPIVDPARVFVVGHSMGAMLAPEIATRAGHVAGIVMIAAPGRPFFDVLVDQIRRSGNQDAIDRAEKERQSIDDPKASPSRYVEGAPIAYYRDLASRNEFEFARRFPGPILLLRGAEDTNVLEVDQDTWIRNLAGRGGVTARTIPGIAHLLAPPPGLPVVAAGTGSSRDARVSKEVIDEIARFVTAPVRRP
jgi:alpha-beta hydrolase superfamily lysophospholipase